MRTIDDLVAAAVSRKGLPSPAAARQLRQELGITQREMAEVLGVTRPTVTRYENGQRVPRGPRAEVYAEALRRLMSALDSSSRKAA